MQRFGIRPVCVRGWVVGSGRVVFQRPGFRGVRSFGVLCRAVGMDKACPPRGTPSDRWQAIRPRNRRGTGCSTAVSSLRLRISILPLPARPWTGLCAQFVAIAAPIWLQRCNEFETQIGQRGEVFYKRREQQDESGNAGIVRLLRREAKRPAADSVSGTDGRNPSGTVPASMRSLPLRRFRSTSSESINIGSTAPFIGDWESVPPLRRKNRVPDSDLTVAPN